MKLGESTNLTSLEEAVKHIDKLKEEYQVIEREMLLSFDEAKKLRDKYRELEDRMYRIKTRTNWERFKAWLKSDSSDRHWSSVDYLGGILRVRHGDKHNTTNFTFDIGIVKVWSMDSFQFEITAVANTHWGIGFVGLLPYLRWVVALPIPQNLGIKFDELTRRKPNKNKPKYNGTQSVLHN